ncbi:hypothetical protein MATL_G00110120 [Megalops atlanticus]|uniref:EF-hand domain-containing protein n=1 Tax=Megalops atlanticus TaxID=7932 RepID=A0A9D3T6N4_MEGAT|nr:hypothetical protein MATL_G00110120 [Megalops atlanticus]
MMKLMVKKLCNLTEESVIGDNQQESEEHMLLGKSPDLAFNLNDNQGRSQGFESPIPQLDQSEHSEQIKEEEHDGSHLPTRKRKVGSSRRNRSAAKNQRGRGWEELEEEREGEKGDQEGMEKETEMNEGSGGEPEMRQTYEEVVGAREEEEVGVLKKQSSPDEHNLHIEAIITPNDKNMDSTMKNPQTEGGDKEMEERGERNIKEGGTEAEVSKEEKASAIVEMREEVLGLEKEQGNKEEDEREEELEIKSAPTSVTSTYESEISDQSQEIEHSTFAGEMETVQDTQVILGRTENQEHESEPDGTKHHSLIEDSVIRSDHHQSEEHMLLGKSPDLAFSLDDSQGRSQEIESPIPQLDQSEHFGQIEEEEHDDSQLTMRKRKMGSSRRSRFTAKNKRGQRLGEFGEEREGEKGEQEEMEKETENEMNQGSGGGKEVWEIGNEVEEDREKEEETKSELKEYETKERKAERERDEMQEEERIKEDVITVEMVESTEEGKGVDCSKDEHVGEIMEEESGLEGNPDLEPFRGETENEDSSLQTLSLSHSEGKLEGVTSLGEENNLPSETLQQQSCPLLEDTPTVHPKELTNDTPFLEHTEAQITDQSKDSDNQLFSAQSDQLVASEEFPAEPLNAQSTIQMSETQTSQGEHNLHIESVIISDDQNMDSEMKTPHAQDREIKIEKKKEDIDERGTEGEKREDEKGSAIEEMNKEVFVMEQEQGSKEEEEMEEKMDIELAPTSVSSIYQPEISDQPQQVEHSTFAGEMETVQDTQVILGRTENIEHESELDGTKHHSLIEDSVIRSDLHQSEEHMLLGKSPDLAFNLNDNQGRSQGFESPIPQLDQSEHSEQIKEEEHDGSHLPTRKRKVGSSRRNRSAAKNQRGRGWEELGEEREGEKGDQEGMEKETEMNEGSGGEPEMRQTYEEVVGAREEEEVGVLKKQSSPDEHNLHIEAIITPNDKNMDSTMKNPQTEGGDKEMEERGERDIKEGGTEAEVSKEEKGSAIVEMREEVLGLEKEQGNKEEDEREEELEIKSVPTSVTSTYESEISDQSQEIEHSTFDGEIETVQDTQVILGRTENIEHESEIDGTKHHSLIEDSVIGSDHHQSEEHMLLGKSPDLAFSLDDSQGRSQEIESPIPQLDQSEHFGQIEEEEHDDSQLTMRKRKMGSSRRSRFTAKNKRGQRLGEFGQEREGEKGEQEEMEKETENEMNQGSGGGKEVWETGNEVEEDREKEEETKSELKEYETKERKAERERDEMQEEERIKEDVITVEMVESTEEGKGVDCSKDEHVGEIMEEESGLEGNPDLEPFRGETENEDSSLQTLSLSHSEGKLEGVTSLGEENNLPSETLQQQSCPLLEDTPTVHPKELTNDTPFLEHTEAQITNQSKDSDNQLFSAQSDQLVASEEFPAEPLNAQSTIQMSETQTSQGEHNLHIESVIISDDQNMDSEMRTPHAQDREIKIEEKKEDIDERGTEGEKREDEKGSAIEEMNKEVFVMEQEQGSKEEEEMEEKMDIELVPTSVTSIYQPEISDQPQQVEHSTFAGEMETVQGTQVILDRTENIERESELDGTKHHSLIEDSVIRSDHHQSEEHMLLGKSPDPAFNLNDNQGRSQGFESPIPQLDQSEHSEQIKEEEHDGSHLPTRKRKVGSSRRSRSAAKNQRGRGWEELEEEREGEKGDQEGMEKETEMNEGSGGEPKMRQTYEEVVGAREEEEVGVLKKQSSPDEHNLHIEAIITPNDKNMDSTMKNPQTEGGDKEMEERGERDIKEGGTEAEVSKEEKGSAIVEMREEVLGLEKEQGNKEEDEREEELEIKSVPTSVTSTYESEISDQSQEIEHSTFAGEIETVQDTQVILGRTENIEHESEVDGTKHHSLIEDSVIGSDHHQSEEHMLLGKSPDLAFSLDDSQGRSQEIESPIPQLDQSEHFGQIEEEEHDDSQLTMRKRKMGSSRRSRFTAKNKRGQRLGEFGEEREGEKGEQEEMEKETENEMNQGSGGGKEVWEIGNEAEEDREKEEETKSELKEYETKERKAERERDEMQEEERIKEDVITVEMVESTEEGKGVDCSKDENVGEIMEEESGLEGNPDLEPFRGETENEDSSLQTLSLSHSEGKLEGVTSLGEENNLPSETLQQQSCPLLEDTPTVHPKELTNDTPFLEHTEAQIIDQSKDSDNQLFSAQSEQLVASEEFPAEPLNTQSTIQMSETQTSQGEHNLHIESVIISDDQNMDSEMKTLHAQDKDRENKGRGEGDIKEGSTEGHMKEDKNGSAHEEMKEEVLGLEEEQGKKDEEEREEEMGMAMGPTSVSSIYKSETSRQPQQFEDSSVAEKMGSVQDTQVPHERIVHVDESDGKKLHSMIEDTVIGDDPQQSEGHILQEKSLDLTFDFNDSHGGSQDTESPVPQVDQSEHCGQIEEEEHDGSQLSMRKRKMGSSRRSRSVAKNQKGRGWEEFGEETEGEKGDQEGKEKKTEMNEGSGGEPEMRQTYEEVVGAREEEEVGVLKKQSSPNEHYFHIESIIIPNDQNMDSTNKNLQAQDGDKDMEERGERHIEQEGTKVEMTKEEKASAIEEMKEEVLELEKEQGNKEGEEREVVLEIGLAPTPVFSIHESDISDQPQEIEHSTFDGEMETVRDTLVLLGKTENIKYESEVDGIKHHRLIEDSVTASDHHQTEEHMLLGKSSDLAFNLNDNQDRSQGFESPIPQLDQSEHSEQIKEEEHDDSHLTMRKRKMGSSRRSRSAAKNQRGRGWEELGEEREGEKGDQEGMEKETEMNEGSGGEPEMRQTYEEVVGAREEEEVGVLKKQSSPDEHNLHIESIIIPNDQNMDSTMKNPQAQDGDKEMEDSGGKEGGTEAEMAKEEKGSAIVEMREEVLGLEKEQGNEEGEEREEVLEIESVPTSVTSVYESEISDQSQQVEHSTFAGEMETVQDTQVILGRTENIEHESELDGTKHHSLIEDSVIRSDHHQSEEHMLLGKSPDLAFSLDDSQGRSQETESPIPQLNQSEHFGQAEEEEDDDSQLTMRKRKMGSSRRSRFTAKNKRGQRLGEFGEEKGGEKGEEGIEKETENEMNQGSGGGKEVRQTYEEVVGAREEEEEGVLKKQFSPDEHNLHIQSIIIPNYQNIYSTMKNPQAQDGDNEMEERRERHIKEEGTEPEMSKAEKGSAMEEMKEEVLGLEKEEDTVICSDHHQSEEHMLLGKSPDLTFSLDDSQGRSQETESPIPQLDQSEHFGQAEEDGCDDSHLAMRKRKMGSSRRSRFSAKNRRGGGWEELGEEGEGETGEQEGKENEMKEASGGGTAVKEQEKEAEDMKKKEEDGADSEIKEYEAKESKEGKTETKQMHEEHLEGEEHDDSWSTNRKRKTGSFHKSCLTAKNQHGRRLGEEREVEKGELGGMDKEEQDEMHVGGEADGRETDKEAVLDWREEGGEAESGVQEYETKERQDQETGKKQVCVGHAESERHEDSSPAHRKKKMGSSRRGLFGAKKQTETQGGRRQFGVERGGEYKGERENEKEGQTVMENVGNVTSHLQSPPLQVTPPHADSSLIESSFELERREASSACQGSEQPRDPATEDIQEGLSEDTERKDKKQEVKNEKEESAIEETKEETLDSLIMDGEKNKEKIKRKEEIRQGKAQTFVSSLHSVGQPEITNHPGTQLPPVKRKLGSSRRARSNALKAERDLGRTDQRGREEDPKVAAILQKIQDVFHRWDIEEKGFITWEEMQGLGRELDISAAELHQVFERLDVDRDGLITPQDFAAGFRELIQFQQHKAEAPAFVYQSDASILSEEVDDNDRKRFVSMLDDLGAYKILQERIQEHNVGVQELYEEMERQISTEKERANREGFEKSRSQVAEMEEQLVKKNSEIEELISVQDELEGSLKQLLRQQQQTAEENQELCRTNQELEAQLKRIRGQLHDTLRHIRGVRRSIDRGASLPRLQRLASAPEGAGGEAEEVPSPQVVPDVQVFQRFGSMLDQDFWQDRYTGPADVKPNVTPQNSAPHKRLISIEEDPLPDLVSLAQPAPPRHGEVLWEKQSGPTREGRQSMSDSSPSLSVPDVLYNVVLVGNSSVGKTSFMKRFQSGEFSLEHCATIGLDSCIQTLLVDGARVILQLWDTAGQERYHSITKQILRKAQGLILMYDITSSQTFLAVRDWLSCIQEGAPDDVIIILLGNKNDSSNREVSSEEGERLARENKIHFMECSAATGDNVSQSMQTLARMLKQKVDKQQEANVTLHKDPQKKKKSGCC